MKIFVYGTLKKGCNNNYILQDCKFISEYVIPGYKLYNCGFPVATPSKKDSMKGELWEIPDDGVVLSRLDRLENEGRMYDRIKENDVSFYVGKNWRFSDLRECPKDNNGHYVWNRG